MQNAGVHNKSSRAMVNLLGGGCGEERYIVFKVLVSQEWSQERC